MGLFEAVGPAIRTICSFPYLRGHYRCQEACRWSKDARRTATVRKLAELAWMVWTEHRAYEERCKEMLP